MKMHNWSGKLRAEAIDKSYKSFIFELCNDCGIALTESNYESICPPWSTDQRGDTSQPSGHVGAGVVEQLQEINELLERAHCEGESHNWFSQGALLERACNQMQQLIVKLEDRGK